MWKLGGHFQAQRRVEFFQIQFGRKQIHDLDAENLGQKQQFAIRHPAELRFQLGQRFAADIPALDLQLGRECFLRAMFLDAKSPHLGADEIERSSHPDLRLGQ